jgi:hypothetical protein
VRNESGNPIVFLDVDGTLLPLGDDPEGRQLVAGVGVRLTALSCELVWATTWGEQANAEIAPRLGLPRLPVVAWESAAEHEPEDRWYGLHWKTRGLVDWSAGRPFAWLDDEITDADREWVQTQHTNQTLLRQVDAYGGVAEEDLAAVEGWLRGL